MSDEPPSDCVYAIAYPNHAVVQRVSNLTGAERTTLEARGYKVRQQSVSASVWPWLLGEVARD